MGRSVQPDRKVNARRSAWSGESNQLTIRRVPEKVKRRLLEQARKESKSLNQVVLEALEKSLGITEEPIEFHDLDDLAGSWVEDPEFDRAIAEMDRPDAELWK